MKRKLSIVGLGAAARNIHLPAYRKIPDLEVVGGCDPLAKSGDFDFPLFPSVDELLDRTTPDILTVATHPSSHFELTRAGLKTGAHVFCEKPFASSLEEADEIISLSNRLGRRVVVNNEFRFMNIHAAAKDYISKPQFGDLLFVSMHQTFLVTEETEAGWRRDDPRRTCKDFGTHVFDLCRFFFDEDPHTISSRMPKPDNPGGPDYLNLFLLEFSNDRVAHITLDRLSRGPHRYLDIRLDGTAGSIETSLGGKIEAGVGIRGGTRRPFATFDVSLGGRARLYHGEKFKKIASDPLDLFPHATERLVRQFLQALDAGTTPPCGAEDNRQTLALMLAAYESHEAKVPIAMAD